MNEELRAGIPVIPTMEDRAQEFKDLLAALSENNTEASSENSMNRFFTEMDKDPQLWERWMDFMLDMISRVAMSGRKTRAANAARTILAALPTTRKYFPQKKLIKRSDQVYWLEQIRRLNLEYTFAAKALMVMLTYHGELSLSRQLFDGMDESLLSSHYIPETDTLRFGTAQQAKAWTIADEMEANPQFAEEQHRKFAEESNTSFEDATGEGKPLPKAEEVVVEESVEEPKDCGDDCRYVPGASDPTRLDLID